MACAEGVERTFLGTFGIRPWLGRDFNAEEDRQKWSEGRDSHLWIVAIALRGQYGRTGEEDLHRRCAH